MSTPFNSGFSRKVREKHLEFRGSLNCNRLILNTFSEIRYNKEAVLIAGAVLRFVESPEEQKPRRTRCAGSHVYSAYQVREPDSG